MDKERWTCVVDKTTLVYLIAKLVAWKRKDGETLILIFGINLRQLLNSRASKNKKQVIKSHFNQAKLKQDTVKKKI